jgi:hypothetical protein
MVVALLGPLNARRLLQLTLREESIAITPTAFTRKPPSVPRYSDDLSPAITGVATDS